MRSVVVPSFPNNKIISPERATRIQRKFFRWLALRVSRLGAQGGGMWLAQGGARREPRILLDILDIPIRHHDARRVSRLSAKNQNMPMQYAMQFIRKETTRLGFALGSTCLIYRPMPSWSVFVFIYTSSALFPCSCFLNQPATVSRSVRTERIIYSTDLSPSRSPLRSLSKLVCAKAPSTRLKAFKFLCRVIWKTEADP